MAGSIYQCTEDCTGAFVCAQEINTLDGNPDHSSAHCVNPNSNPHPVDKRTADGNCEGDSGLTFCIPCHCPPSILNTSVVGDPQFVGLRGQSFQVHGIDNAVYNIITDTRYQLNARFIFLNGPRSCPVIPSTGRKASMCWSHDGSYLNEIGLKVPDSALFIKAGSSSVGFETVTLNGRTAMIGEETSAFSFNSTHEITLWFEEWMIEVENSDGFVNLRSVQIIPQLFHNLSSHGLLGQTWSKKRYSGMISAIEGEIDDYLIDDGSIFGESFVFNKYNQIE